MPVGSPSSETINTTTREYLIDKVIDKAAGWQWQRTVSVNVSAITADGFMRNDWEVIAQDGDVVLLCLLDEENGKFTWGVHHMVGLQKLNPSVVIQPLSFKHEEATSGEPEIIELVKVSPGEAEILESAESAEAAAKRIKDTQAAARIQAELLLMEIDDTWRVVNFAPVRVPRKGGRIEDNWEIIAIGQQGCFVWQYDSTVPCYNGRKFIPKDVALALNPHLTFPTDTESQNPDPSIRWIRMGQEKIILE